jgi:hypothetical protein
MSITPLGVKLRQPFSRSGASIEKDQPAVTGSTSKCIHRSHDIYRQSDQ